MPPIPASALIAPIVFDWTYEYPLLILAVMATFLYFTRLQMVAELGDDLDLRTTMFARIDLITQIATLLLQALVAGRLMQRVGVPLTLALLPLTTALGFVGLAMVGSLLVLFRPRPMAWVMVATAVAQVAVFAYAWLADLGFVPVFTVVMCGLWLASANLFRRAAGQASS